MFAVKFVTTLFVMWCTMGCTVCTADMSATTISDGFKVSLPLGLAEVPGWTGPGFSSADITRFKFEGYVLRLSCGATPNPARIEAVAGWDVKLVTRHYIHSHTRGTEMICFSA